MAIVAPNKPVTNRIADLVADRLKKENEEAGVQYELLTIDLANRVQVTADRINETLRRAGVSGETLDADLRRIELCFTCVAEMAAAAGVADEKAQLEGERRELIQKLQDALQPIELRLSEIEVKERKAERAEGVLRRTPRKNLQRHERQVIREIAAIKHKAKLDVAGANNSVLTAADRELVTGNGRGGFMAERGVDASAAARALARANERLEQFLAMQEVARSKVQVLEARLERLMQLRLLALPTAEQIEAALQEPEQETTDQVDGPTDVAENVENVAE